MSKKLTPLEALQNLTEYLTGSYRDCFEELSIIETALNKLEGLEKVYKVARDYEEELTKDRDYWRDEAYKKQLKALEIIKECFELNGFDELVPNNKWFENKEKQKLLKEVLL